MRTYAGITSNPEHHFVAVNPKPGYDIGIILGKGKIDLYTDMWGGSVAETLGQDLNKLKMEYAQKIIEDEFLYSATITKTENTNGTWTIKVEQL